MHHLFEPRLVNETFGDPGLYVDFRDERRALLFDLGDITVLPPRKLMRLSHVFVTHTHMDHFSGFDHLLRVVLGRKAAIRLLGGPGFISSVEHKLRAYTWNVVHRYEIDLALDVSEIGTDGRALRAHFGSRSAFAREALAPIDPVGDVLHDEMTFRLRGRFVDHDVPCLAFAIEEKAHLKVDKERLTALGLGTGPWLRELKHAVLSGAADTMPIELTWRDASGTHATTRAVAELRDVILDVVPGRRVGYVTDLRYTEANVQALTGLLADVDVLFIESVFLDCDHAQAARKNHLTARQAGLIARHVGAKAVVPFHFSPRYDGRAAELAAEVQAAWSGSEVQPAGS
jgi:ribonuclease Z